MKPVRLIKSWDDFQNIYKFPVLIDNMMELELSCCLLWPKWLRSGKKQHWNKPYNSEVVVPFVYAGYYYLEALLRY